MQSPSLRQSSERERINQTAELDSIRTKSDTVASIATASPPTTDNTGVAAGNSVTACNTALTAGNSNVATGSSSVATNSLDTSNVDVSTSSNSANGCEGSNPVTVSLTSSDVSSKNNATDDQ